MNQTAILLDQACNFAEVDALTLDVLLLDKIDEAKFRIAVCGGVALGLDGHLYVLVRRFKVDDAGLGNIDGISLIAGSENFLVLSTFDRMAGIFDPLSNPIVTGTKIGSGVPLVGGDDPKIPDASLTVCANGSPTRRPAATCTRPRSRATRARACSRSEVETPHRRGAMTRHHPVRARTRASRTLASAVRGPVACLRGVLARARRGLAGGRRSEVNATSERSSTEADASQSNTADGIAALGDLRLRQAAAEVRARLFARPRAPVQIRGYTILGSLGEGGMGQVFAALDERLGRKVALKLLRLGTAGDPRREARLLREAQALARISHPHVVQVYEVGEADEQRFIAMEYIEGATLRSWLAEGYRPWREVLGLLLVVGRGLQAIHAVGLVHRDVKPDNVMIAADGRPRIVDLGLACEDPDTRAQDSFGPELALTTTGVLVGTPAYMAPEQFQAGSVDARTDVFSFCAVAWEALLGRSAFRGADLASRRAAVLAGEVDLDVAGDVPTRVRRVLLRGLATAPEDRHDSMEALLDALERAARPRWAARVVLGVVACGALGVPLLLSGAPEAEDTAHPAEATPAAALDPKVAPWAPPPGCAAEPGEAPAFTYERTVDLGLVGVQAAFYNHHAEEMVFFSYRGRGKRLSIEGEHLGDVEAPVDVTSILDGAAYDPFRRSALLVDQTCMLAEVDPVTMEPLRIASIPWRFGLRVCSGIAVGPEGDLYVASAVTDEVVILSRDLDRVIRRFRVDDDGLTNVDGISLLAGSGHLLLLSTFDRKAAIFTTSGELVAPPAEIGGPDGWLRGGDEPVIPDGTLAVCADGRLWLCEALEGRDGCYVYIPRDGESDSCACLLPP